MTWIAPTYMHVPFLCLIQMYVRYTNYLLHCSDTYTCLLCVYYVYIGLSCERDKLAFRTFIVVVKLFIIQSLINVICNSHYRTQRRGGGKLEPT